MIRVKANLMMVQSLKNPFAKGIKNRLSKKIENGELFIALRVVDTEDLRGKGVKDIYTEVEIELNGADLAIIILSKDNKVTNGTKRKSIYHPRPNVCYEYGFLMSKLGRERILPLVDNTDGSEWGPNELSDLIGAFQERCQNIDDAYVSIERFLTDFGATKKAHDDWGKLLNLDNFRGFQTLQSSYALWVKEQVEEAAQKDKFGLGWKFMSEQAQFLLDELGVDVADRVTIPLLEQSGEGDDEALQAYHIVKAMFDYWATKDYPPKNRLLDIITKSLDKAAAENQWKKDIKNTLLRVIYCDYKGLVCESRSKPSISKQRKAQKEWKSKANDWFQQASTEALKLKGDLRYLWLGYLEFNKARMMEYVGPPDETIKLYDVACKYRKKIVDRAKGTILEEGRKCQLAIALGFYLKYLKEMKASEYLIKRVSNEYKGDLNPYVQTLGLPRSAMQARAITNLLGAGMNQILHKYGWDIPENTEYLVKVASEYSNKLGPVLGAGYIDRTQL